MKVASTFGFIYFIQYFYFIYQHYVPKDSTIQQNRYKRQLFQYFVTVWSFYGIASYMSYDIKNSMFNVLDLFAKNFYGLFLLYYMIQLEKLEKKKIISVVQ